ncbi:hypothetical protein TDB9533_02436 [Thalassocella blandensis]|nr:hypothetical protein TDB9533_02436 [Thalassocella blandensis]
MKKTILAASFSLISSVSFAQQNPMVEMSISMMKQNGQLEKLAACTGKSPAKLESGMREVLNLCMAGNDFSQEQAMNNCMEKNMQTKLGVSKAKLESCKSEEERQEGAIHSQMAKIEQQMAKITQEEEAINAKSDLSAKDEARLEILGAQFAELEEKLFALEDNADMLGMSEKEKAMHELLEKGDALSAKDRQKMEALQQAVVQENMDKMGRQMQMLSKASEGTLDSITLPMYNNSNVLMHVPQGMKMGEGVKALPAATFSSSDSVDKIAAYYQKTLPNYKVKKMDDGQVIIMETMPKDFDVLKHFNEYATTPHVTITPVADAGVGLPKGTKSTIEIAYRAKK